MSAEGAEEMFWPKWTCPESAREKVLLAEGLEKTLAQSLKPGGGSGGGEGVSDPPPPPQEMLSC